MFKSRVAENGKLNASFLPSFPLPNKALLSLTSNPLPQTSKKLPMSDFLPLLVYPTIGHCD
ncbi:hypothetical protein FXE63_06150 [Vibrio mimicus]|nr:hypothetical protein FXF05_00950 [Vibrio mimicus]TXZ08345.1 hypothetical protein FXE63_06150 [Vibrio mimicus]